MATLAQNYWDPNSKTQFAESRIDWVFSHCESYFFKGGLQASNEVEIKKMTALVNDSSYTSKFEAQHFDQKLKLLDVGSCYNPFSKFEIFEVTAIDIAPGNESVAKCDFLNINIGVEFQRDDKEIHSLAENYFEVVVFSLLLEYFPCTEARFKCCENAYHVLKPGGILVVITPDSKHATANAPLMKQWRIALATLGFWRVEYEKLQHLHCMIFKKSSDPNFPKLWSTKELTKSKSFQSFQEPHEMMAIPQDSNQALEEETVAFQQKIEADSDMFNELPNELSD
jgi:25S rRNA (adenine2142-N1)-methyltransferase